MTHTSALLETSEWHICIQRVAAVDPRSSGPQFVGSIQGAVDVLSKDGGSQTVRGVVRLADNIFLVLEFDDNTDGAEDLLLDNLHIRLGIGENSGLNGSEGRMSPNAAQRGSKRRACLDKVTLVSETAPTNVNLCTLLLARINVRHDPLERICTIMFVVEKEGVGERTSYWP